MMFFIMMIKAISTAHNLQIQTDKGYLDVKFTNFIPYYTKRDKLGNRGLSHENMVIRQIQFKL